MQVQRQHFNSDRDQTCRRSDRHDKLQQTARLSPGQHKKLLLHTLVIDR
jgi:hypothetical protein